MIALLAMGKFTDPGVSRSKRATQRHAGYNIHTVRSWPRSCRERKREKEREKEEIKGKGEKSDSNSLLHREHGHDVKAKRRRALHPSATFPSVAECQCLGRFLEFRRKIDDPQPGQPDNETLESRSFTFLVVGQKSCSCRKNSRRISRAFIFACVFRFEFVVWVCAKLRFMAGSGV